MTLTAEFANPTPPAALMTDTDSPEGVTIETRFGAFTFTPEQTVEMPTGMVGFPEHKAFGLATPPEEGYENFVILQCLTEPALGFVTAPTPKQDGPYEDADLREALAAYGVDWDDAAILLVCTIRVGEGGAPSLSVNMQAPVIVDARRRCAWQHVFHSAKYPVRHELI